MIEWDLKLKFPVMFRMVRNQRLQSRKWPVLSLHIMKTGVSGVLKIKTGTKDIKFLPLVPRLIVRYKNNVEEYQRRRKCLFVQLGASILLALNEIKL